MSIYNYTLTDLLVTEVNIILFEAKSDPIWRTISGKAYTWTSSVSSDQLSAQNSLKIYIKFLDTLLDIIFIHWHVYFSYDFFLVIYIFFISSNWQNSLFLDCQGQTLTVGQPTSVRSVFGSVASVRRNGWALTCKCTASLCCAFVYAHSVVSS